VAERYKVSREDQDRFALQSHQRALAAIAAGRFEAEIAPYPVRDVVYADGQTKTLAFDFKVDEGPRKETSAEALAKLKPVFRSGGTVTAGNASQMSDGAAATVIASGQVVRALGVNPIARLVGFAVAGVAPDVMGVGPIPAIAKVLKQTGLKVSDIGLVELNEAFAAQALAVIREVGFDEAIVNVNGGAIALGHPLGCTGAKLTATLLHEMKRRGVRYGICTMCIGGGMGAAAVFERL
jgi:acetyl-CoA acyltransferase